MGLDRSRVHSARLVVLGIVLAGMLIACGDEEESGTTAVSDSVSTTLEASSTSSSVESTTSLPMGANVESLSYLIQGLLRTDQIGNGWVDQGRQIVPPGSNQMTGFLCEEGDAVVAGLEGRADPQVSTTFRRDGDVGLTVFESLMWGDRDQVIADFDAVAEGVRSCADQTYSTSELGEIKLSVDRGPSYGSKSIAYRFAPSVPSTSNPWLEQATTAVLLEEPNQPVALVIAVGATTVHDPSGAEVSTIEDAEYQRIVKAAVDRILEGL